MQRDVIPQLVDLKALKLHYHPRLVSTTVYRGRDGCQGGGQGAAERRFRRGHAGLVGEVAGDYEGSALTFACNQLT